MPGSIASMFVSVGADVSDALKGLNQVDSAVSKAAQSISGAGRDLTTALTVPIVGAGVAIGAIGIGFESAFVKVRKTVDETTTDLDALEKGIIDLSASNKGAGKSAEELANIAAVAGQLGVEGADNILNLTRIVANFGLATGLATDQAAADLEALRILTRTPREEFENLANTIVDLGNRTAATEGQIVEIAKRLAGTLSTVGVKAEDILGIAAAMGSLQIEPEAGGTAVSKLFVEMSAAASGAGSAVKDNSKQVRELQDRLTDLNSSLATAQQRQQQFGRNTPASEVQATADSIKRYQREISEAQSDLDGLNDSQKSSTGSIENFARVAGVTVDEFKDMVKNDPKQAFLNIVKGIAAIREAEGPGAALKALADIGVDDVRMRDAILKLSTGLDLLGSSLGFASKGWEDNNASQKEADKALQSTENQFNLLLNELKAEFIPLWKNELRPIVLEVGRIFKENIIPAIRSVISAFSSLTPEQQKVVLAILGIVAIAGPVLLALGAIAAAIGAIATPVGGVVLAIALLATAWALNLGDIQGKTQTFLDWFLQHWQLIVGAVPILGPVLVATITNFDKLWAAAKRAFELLGTFFTFLVTVGDRAVREFASVWEKTLFPVLKNIGRWIADHVIAPILTMLQFLKPIVDLLFPGGFDIGNLIDQGEAALKQLTSDIAAGGPGTVTAGQGTTSFNAPLVQINNPVLTDPEQENELVQRIAAWVATALVASEQESGGGAAAPPAFMQPLPGHPF